MMRYVVKILLKINIFCCGSTNPNLAGREPGLSFKYREIPKQTF